MLKQLQITNFALIDHLDITFDAGFSVVTGETGAGKSIILGAIGLLLGQRADTKSIKTGAQKCTIEAHFNLANYGMAQWFDDNDLDCDEDDCVIRRELTATGKSRGFINDTPVSLHLMRELGDMLMDVHSQHQNLLLQKEDFQLNTVDIIAQNTLERNDYQKAYVIYQDAQKKLSKLKEDIESARQNEEFMRFQLEELTKAELSEGEQEELEQEAESANHTEDIKSALYEADNLLGGEDNSIIDNLRMVVNRIENICDVFPRVNELSERLNSSYIELKDISSEISDALEDVDFDPRRLEFINDRLDTIYSLQRKYNVDTVEELIAERERLQTAIDAVDNSEGELAEQEALVLSSKKEADKKAEVLSKSRKKAAKKVEEEIHQRLISLGMPNVQFKVDITTSPLSRDGIDSISFLFSANKGMALRPVAQVASGGEIARVMLSLKAMLSGAVKLPTIIFDEIDTGVSGKMAEKMAEIMKEMGNADRQVISITHLPQIAAMGNAHYKVEKYDTEEGTNSMMRRLTDDERIIEIAQMMSGENVSEAAISNAKELLRKK
ncbi:MAG: DNA repair protein RecN [Prevotella sp.]|nr:DNA repair protein RecN [Prevotella sp.]